MSSAITKTAHRSYVRQASSRQTAKASRDPRPATDRPRAVQTEADRAAFEARVAHVMDLPLDYMASKEFGKPNAGARILGPMPDAATATRKARRPADLPEYLAALYEVPLLTAEQERYLFRKYNYLKFRASQVREELNPNRPSVRLLTEIEKLFAQAIEAKNEIIRANLRLVVSIAKKRANEQDTFFDMVSDGNMSLFRAVEKFDYMLGFKFSTYATWAIKKNFAREHMTRARYADRFRNSMEEPLDWTPDDRADVFEQERMQRRRQAEVDKVLDCLSDREREIIRKRFGLQGHPEAQTLQAVGSDLGVSKERIRQIESRALAKLRESVGADLIDTL